MKQFDDRTIDHIQNRFDEESGTALINTWKRLCEEAAELQESGAAPESEEGQAVAEEWWDMVKDFTGGDMSLLPELIKFSVNRDGWDEGWKAKQASADIFIQKAMSVYFKISDIIRLRG